MKKLTFISVICTVLLAACSPPPGSIIASNELTDYAMDCEEIQKEIEYVHRKVAKEDITGSGIISLNREAQLDSDYAAAFHRDANARISVLQRLAYSKNCNAQKAAGGSNSAEQPSTRQKSRVIICSDGDNCIIE